MRRIRQNENVQKANNKIIPLVISIKEPQVLITHITRSTIYPKEIIAFCGQVKKDVEVLHANSQKFKILMGLRGGAGATFLRAAWI